MGDETSTMPRERPTANNSNAGTILALLGLFFVSGSLLFLTALVLPQVLGILIVVFGFVFFIAVHYLLWGRWMMQRVAEAEEQKSSPPPAEH